MSSYIIYSTPSPTPSMSCSISTSSTTSLHIAGGRKSSSDDKRPLVEMSKEASETSSLINHSVNEYGEETLQFIETSGSCSPPPIVPQLPQRGSNDFQVEEATAGIASLDIEPNVVPKPNAKSRIYEDRRAPTARPATPSPSSFPIVAGEPEPAPSSDDASPTPPAMDSPIRQRLPSKRRQLPHGPDLNFGGLMIPFARRSSAMRIAVLVRLGMVAEENAKKLEEERQRALEMAARQQTVKRRYQSKGLVLLGHPPAEDVAWDLV
ncbi:hypothetical protein MIND_01325800 [Mycena indigotica]|uniref:Uncharacterized protein n=1 Tax=Mycena indigotica TaxID=2126181 RepID=A0A8H6S2H9_9AGAR|nr:uncharacterized protein MIND_01325800 [Mycena indigotica]KAF7290846.1 hypothetical protein MIND_01325800 [Mycena indigotica]